MLNLFRKEAVNQQQTRLYGEVIISQPTSYYWITLLMVSITVITVALLFWGTYARKETVQGYVSITEGVSRIYSERNGFINQIFVSEGQQVEKHQKLISVSTKRDSYDSIDIDSTAIKELEKIVESYMKNKELDVEVSSLEQKQLQVQIEDLSKNIKQKKARLTIFEEKLNMARNNMQDSSVLLKKNVLSNIEYQKKKEEFINKTIEYQGLELDIQEEHIQLNSLKNRLAKLPIQNKINLSSWDTKISSLKREILELKSNQEVILRSAINGRVTGLQVKSGEHINTRISLMTILPENSMFNATLFIPAKAIGFVKEGQKVKIRYSAFPYQRYGIYTGKIKQIARVTTEVEDSIYGIKSDSPVYRATVELSEQNVLIGSTKVNLQVGMELQADIILEDLSFLDWVFEPVVKLKGRLQ